MQGLVQASEGYSLVGADLSGLELRFQVLPEGQRSLREVVEGDVHTANMNGWFKTCDQARRSSTRCFTA